MHGNRRAAPYEERELVDVGCHQSLAIPGESFAGQKVEPDPRRKPNGLSAKFAWAHPRFSDRSDQQVIAKEILLRVTIRLRLVCVIEVHRPGEGDGFPTGLDDARIDVGEEFRAELKAAAHGSLGPRRISPRPAIHADLASRVRAQRRAQRSKLTPPGVGFLVAAAHVPADVMGPKETADITGCCRKRHLECQHLPAGVGIAGEVNRMPVVAPAGPAAEGLAPGPAALRAAVVIVIQPCQILDVRHAARERILLPVQPPEIDAIFFQCRMRVPVKCLEVLPVAGIERQCLAGFRVHPHVAHESLIHGFMGSNAIGGMIVQRHMDALLVKPLQELFRIRQEFAVPRKTGPDLAVRRRSGTECFPLIGDMPIHVHDDHVERELFCRVLLDDLPVICGGIGPVPGIPGTESVPPRQRDRAGNGRERLQRRAIVLTVPKQIPVTAPVRPALHPTIDLQRPGGIVE